MLSHLRQSKYLNFRRPFKRVDYLCSYAHSTSQIEIFQIHIDKFDEMERRGELYGKIEIINLDGCLTLYHRSRENAEHIRANSPICLIGFPCSISNVIGFSVTIDLRLCHGSVVDDVLLGKWQFIWDILEPNIARVTGGGGGGGVLCQDIGVQDDVEADLKYQVAGYDRPLSVTFESPGRCITMYYAIFKHAAQVWIQIELVDMNDGSTTGEFDAHGRVTATYSHFEYDNDSNFKDHCKVLLINTKELESVKVEYGKKIPLARSIIAVPLYASLVIEADLWSTSGSKIAKGKVELSSKHLDVGVDYIRGEGDVAVRVMLAWSYGSRTPGCNPF